MLDLKVRLVESRNRWGADLIAGVGVDKGGGPRIVLQDEAGDQQLQALGASSLAAQPTEDVTRACSLQQ